MNIVEKIYTEEYLRKIRRYFPLITRIGKPKSFRHFIIEAIACLTHNTFEKLHLIKCPTLIIEKSKEKVEALKEVIIPKKEEKKENKENTEA